MAQNIMAQPTASQQAAAQLHLERQSKWRYIRVNGTRYAVLPSGRSNRTYWVRDDARGCSCLWYIRTGTTCSHMLSVRLSRSQKPKAGYADLFPACRKPGCEEPPAIGEKDCSAHVLVDAF